MSNSLSLAFVILSALVALSAGGTVVINGKCQNCSPPDAETVVVGNKVYKGTPGHGTVIIGGGGPGQASGGPGAGSGVGPLPGGGHGPGGPVYIKDGYSGPIPGGSYVHNKDCVGCSISGGGD